MTETTQTQTNGAEEPKTPSIPEADYAAVMVSVGDLEESKKEKTVFRNVVFKIVEDGPFKGKQLVWTAFFSEKTAQRSFEAFLGSGCTFPNGDVDDFHGLGTKEQIIVVKHEPFEFTPQPTDDNPTPKVVKGIRARVAFVNNGVRGMQGDLVADNRKAVLKPQLQNYLGKARTGDRSSADAQGNRVDQGGTLRDKKGGAIF